MSIKPKKAFVLAAGLGTRMRPLTDNLPKPMIEVAGRTLIDRVIDRLVEAGVETVVVNTFYLPEIIEEHLAKRDDVEVLFSRESERLETGGGIKNALKLIGDEPFYVTSSDVIWQDKSSLQTLADNWQDDLYGLLLLHKADGAYGYDGAGDFDLHENGKISFAKGGAAEYVFSTIQILNPILFKQAEAEALGAEFRLRALYELFTDRFHGVENSGDWFHIGTPEAVEGLMDGLK